MTIAALISNPSVAGWLTPALLGRVVLVHGAISRIPTITRQTLDKTTGNQYMMGDEEFEWDAAKAKSNLAKHKVSFEAARLVFGDFFALDRLDVSAAPAEDRCVITGMANGVLLTVVYAERGDRIRIISARKATKHEQKEYYSSQTSE